MRGHRAFTVYLIGFVYVIAAIGLAIWLATEAK